MQGTYVNLFYLSVGANISYMAFFIALARSLDVVTDPAMAWWTDNGCRTRFGRRKPFLVCGMFLYNISWYLFLTPPASLEHPGISIWFGLLFTCFYLCDTLTQIPYLAFGTEFTNSYTERNSLWFFSNGAGNVGTLLGMVEHTNAPWHTRCLAQADPVVDLARTSTRTISASFPHTT